MAPALQISIPTTSTATPSDSKPYSLYHITLQLPLRRHETKKRYTDFVNLHAALNSETSASPPSPLPPKSWIRRTFSNPDLLEKRRQGLEQYLHSILNASDSRWRSSSAWRSFLNLPAGNNTMNANGTLTARSASSNTIGESANDPNGWIEAHRELKSQIQAARQQLKQREAATTAQSQHGLSADAKASLVRAAASIARLDNGLKAITAASQGDDAGWGGSQRLGDGEIRRRRDLMKAAKMEVEGLEGVLRSMATRAASASASGSSNVTSSGAVSAAEKGELWKGTNTATKPSGRVLGGPLKETERTRERDNEGVLMLQKQIMQEQEEDVLSLGKTVAKLKDMGIMINEELAIQNEMLGVVEDDTERLQNKIDIARNRIKKIN